MTVIRRNKYQVDWQANFIRNVEYVIRHLGITKTELSRDTGRNSSYWTDTVSQKRTISLHQAVNIACLIDFTVDDLIKSPPVFEDTAASKIDKWQKRIEVGERKRIRQEIKQRAYAKSQRGCKGKQKTVRPTTV